MFYLSKLFWIAAQPLSLVFFLLVLVLLSLFFRRRTMAACFAFGASGLLFLVLYTTLGTVLLQPLEARFVRPAQKSDNIGCMIVLGGAFDTEVTTARGGYEFNPAGDRFLEMLRLMQMFPQSRALVSGGDGSITGQYEGDAVISERFLVAFGISPERLIKETTSRTTYENTMNTKSLLAQNGLSDCLLITSAFHMPRSVGLFRKAGIAIVPWPTDYRTPGNRSFGLDFTQPSTNAQITATAFREWIGLFAYYYTGRTSALYPRQR